MRLVWTPLAREDRDAIFDRIAKDNAHAAIGVDERIGVAAKQLLAFPESGRPGRVENTRELVVPRSPYIIAYQLLPGRVRILRVLHGAQIWPESLDTQQR